jgi:hypothetical protein
MRGKILHGHKHYTKIKPSGEIIIPDHSIFTTEGNKVTANGTKITKRRVR